MFFTALQTNAAAEKDLPNPPTGLAKLAKENVEAEHELLVSLDKKFKENGGDPGPVYDVVLVQDGDSW